MTSFARLGLASFALLCLASAPPFPGSPASADVGQHPVVRSCAVYWERLEEFGRPPVFGLRVALHAEDADGPTGTYLLAVQDETSGTSASGREPELFGRLHTLDLGDYGGRRGQEEFMARVLASGGVVVACLDTEGNQSNPIVVRPPRLPKRGAPLVRHIAVDYEQSSAKLSGENLGELRRLKVNGERRDAGLTFTPNVDGTEVEVGGDVAGAFPEGGESTVLVRNGAGWSNPVVWVGRSEFRQIGEAPTIESASAELSEPYPGGWLLTWDVFAQDPDSARGGVVARLYDAEGTLIGFEGNRGFWVPDVFGRELRYGISGDSDIPLTRTVVLVAYDFEGNRSDDHVIAIPAP